MLGRTLREETNLPNESAILLGTFPQIHKLAPELKLPGELHDDGFWLATARIRGHDCLVIASPNDRGVLYGVFALLRKIALSQEVTKLDNRQQPSAPLRWVNEWDDLDGTIVRGYGGPSIFFDNGVVRSDLSRVSDYGRLLASLGINGCVINNVNADPRLMEDRFLPQIARIAAAFRPWGVRLGVSVNFGSPKDVGGLSTFDPLDPAVAAWWKGRIDAIYREIPDFGGFVMKADSEGEAGPASYGRTPADAANVIARALKPHGGVLFYRAFVYNHHLDWRNPKNDRARAAYDIFHPLDGKFEDNVVIQIKNGPIDFQVREPASPLFAGLEKTNQAIELQITQEYLGQQRHLCFLVPMWKETLDFDMHAEGEDTPVKDLIAGKTFHRPLGGYVGVSDVGLDPTWLGTPLAMVNLYGFGRLAWDPNLSSKAIVDEWTRLTFGNDPLVLQTIEEIQLFSWSVYESYTGPLGLQTLTNILGAHYGPGIEASERNGWGQWHDADHKGVGLNRSMATGTGFTGQYPPAVARMYESLSTTPDNLVLFFHHVPYTYVLHSGKTVIQELYDLHYQGAEHAREYVKQWEALRGRVDEQRYALMLARFKYQAGHAIVWRDAVCNWFFRTSGIADAKGRVGHHPDRIEAEAMQLNGYVPMVITPSENASGGKGVQCPARNCSASVRFGRPAGWYEIDVQYFDQNNGVSKFQLFVGDQMVDEWAADDHLPAIEPGGDSSTRRWIPGLALRPGDEIKIVGTPDGAERAPLDYIRIVGPQP
jgi:alpha-glucuronidase